MNGGKGGAVIVVNVFHMDITTLSQHEINLVLEEHNNGKLNGVKLPRSLQYNYVYLTYSCNFLSVCSFSGDRLISPPGNSSTFVRKIKFHST